jgi:hypothetical protein
VQQGSKDASCPWAKAHLGWVTQLLARLRKREFKADEECNKHIRLTSTPDCFDQSKLPPLYIHHIAFWDEVHKEQVAGVTGCVTYAFPHDNDKAFDKGGEVADKAMTLHIKYNTQGRL